MEPVGVGASWTVILAVGADAVRMWCRMCPDVVPIMSGIGAVGGRGYAGRMKEGTSLTDTEFELLFGRRLADAALHRAQALCSLIGDAGLSGERVQALTVLELAKIRDDEEMPGRTREMVARLLDTVPDRLYPLSAGKDGEMTADAIRKVLLRHGEKMGVAGVSVGRLRVTFARRQYESGEPRATIASALGVSDLRVRRMLAQDRRARQPA